MTADTQIGRASRTRVEPLWDSPRRFPGLDAGALHVWLAYLARIEEDLLTLLTEEEWGRAARFPRTREGQLWARSRSVLRDLLGRYLQRDPGALRFSSGPQGKPALSGSGRISFNLSHSGELALYAFAREAAVGVDIELGRRRVYGRAVALRAFGAEVGGQLAELDPSRRRQAFLSAWALHEAELKCLGVGGAAAGALGRRLWTTELEVGPGAAAAVASDHGPNELHCWSWQRTTRAAA